MDGIRFVAIASVLLHHVEYALSDDLVGGEWLRRLWETGNLGVDVFFALSGFLLALPFLKRGGTVDLARYAKRRLVRLEPPYLVCLLFLMGIGFYDRTDADVWHFLASATYTHGLAYGSMSTINFVAWSLEIEVQFYLVMPLLALLVARGSTLRRRGGLAVLGGLFLFSRSAADVWEWTLVYHLPSFIAGMWVADWFVFDWDGKPPVKPWADGVALLAWVAMPGVMLWLPDYGPFVMPFLLFVALGQSFQSVWVRRLLSLQPLTIVGGMCYSIYLYHWLFLQMALQIGGIPTAGSFYGVLLYLPLLIVAVLAGCTFCFALIERPLMKVGA